LHFNNKIAYPNAILLSEYRQGLANPATAHYNARTFYGDDKSLDAKH